MKHSIIKDFNGWSRIMEEMSVIPPTLAPNMGPAPVQGGPLGTITSKDGALTADDIKKVQALLWNVPITDSNCDGVVGPQTKERIKAFRTSKGITAETTEPTQTSVGPQTLGVMNTEIMRRDQSSAPAQPAAAPFDRKPEDDKLAEKICTEIVAKFGDPAFWKPFKGAFNDDEAGATKAYNEWYASTIEPQVKGLRPGDPNAESITSANQRIVLKLSGGQGNDEAEWPIQTLQGEKRYKVDTDF